MRHTVGNRAQHRHGGPAMIPAGFVPHMRRSPLTEPWEPLYARETPSAVQLGLEIRPAHCNARGFAHGGLLCALADNAMGLSAVRLARQDAESSNVNAVTVALSLDFIDAAHVGNWVEIHPTVLKVGHTLAFVECKVVCGERLIARGNASFRMLGAEPAKRKAASSRGPIR